jgi:hypothetical protein
MATPPPIQTNRHACSIGAKSLFKAINDRSPEAGEARKFFEYSRPTVQCNAVVSYKTECWICGNAFNPTYPALSPQCEHILPIAQGVIFLELYTSRKGTVTDAMKLEYDWAHAICNQVKNASVLIKGTQTNFEPDVDKIAELLQVLYSKGIHINEEQIYHIQGKLFEITDFINKTPDYSINLLGDICPRKLVFKGGRKTFKRKHNGRTVRRISGKNNRSAAGAYRKVRAQDSRHNRTSTRKNAHFKSK